jgi:hypothetical protein
MYPGENPRRIPVVRDYPDARHEEYEEWGYNAYDESGRFSQDYDPPRGFDSCYNASVSFSNHPS